jgi:hypothetical protein
MFNNKQHRDAVLDYLLANVIHSKTIATNGTDTFAVVYKFADEDVRAAALLLSDKYPVAIESTVVRLPDDDIFGSAPAPHDADDDMN